MSIQHVRPATFGDQCRINGHLPYDRLPSHALAEMPAADRAAWRSR